MTRFLKLHLHGMKIAFLTSSAYRIDFFVGLLVILAEVMLSPLFVILIYGGGGAIGDYDIYQIFLIQGVYLTASGIGSVFFFNIVWATTFLVREGSLDIMMLKPHSLLSSLVATSYNKGGAANILGGLLLFIYALANLPAPDPSQWVRFGVLFAAALAVLFAMSVILAGLGIIWVGNSRLFDIYGSISRFASYPMTIFQKNLRRILTFIIPVALIGFLPASVLLGMSEPYLYASLLCAVLFVAAALLFWRLMIRRYTSAGG